jgi:hypothetical protein
MRKPDEIALYAYMRTVAAPIASTEAAANALGICHQRAYYLVEKWMGKWWCDGVSGRFVYFLPEAPSALLTWGVVQ